MDPPQKVIFLSEMHFWTSGNGVRVRSANQKNSILPYLSFKKKRKEIGSFYEELQVKMHFWSYRRPGWGFFQKISIFVLFGPK